jgi:hypothetical protein
VQLERTTEPCVGFLRDGCLLHGSSCRKLYLSEGRVRYCRFVARGVAGTWETGFSSPYSCKKRDGVEGKSCEVSWVVVTGQQENFELLKSSRRSCLRRRVRRGQVVWWVEEIRGWRASPSGPKSDAKLEWKKVHASGPSSQQRTKSSKSRPNNAGWSCDYEGKGENVQVIHQRPKTRMMRVEVDGEVCSREARDRNV